MPAVGIAVKPAGSSGGLVLALMMARVPLQHIGGRRAQTHSVPPCAATSSAACGLTCTRIWHPRRLVTCWVSQIAYAAACSISMAC